MSGDSGRDVNHSSPVGATERTVGEGGHSVTPRRVVGSPSPSTVRKWWHRLQTQTSTDGRWDNKSPLRVGWRRRRGGTIGHEGGRGPVTTRPLESGAPESTGLTCGQCPTQPGPVASVAKGVPTVDYQPRGSPGSRRVLSGTGSRPLRRPAPDTIDPILLTHGTLDSSTLVARGLTTKTCPTTTRVRAPVSDLESLPSTVPSQVGLGSTGRGERLGRRGFTRWTGTKD